MHSLVSDNFSSDRTKIVTKETTVMIKRRRRRRGARNFLCNNPKSSKCTRDRYRNTETSNACVIHLSWIQSLYARYQAFLNSQDFARECSQSMYNYLIWFLFHAHFGRILFSICLHQWRKRDVSTRNSLRVPFTTKVLVERQMVCLRGADVRRNSSLPMAEDVWKDCEVKKTPAIKGKLCPCIIAQA